MKLALPATRSALTLCQPSIRRFAQWSAMQEAFQKEDKKPKESEKEPIASKPTPSKPELPSVDKNSFQGATLNDNPLGLTEGEGTLNWSSSFHGLGTLSFGKEIQQILGQPIASDDIEITPDGLIYLPEIKYRRILNKSFGAGGWGLAPRSQTMIAKNGFQNGAGTLTREYALIANGRLVSIARGEQDFFSEKGIPTATEGCKSNALMRCCKDLGIASELWDPKFIREFKKKYTENVFVEHVPTKKKKKIWKRKDGFVDYPFKL